MGVGWGGGGQNRATLNQHMTRVNLRKLRYIKIIKESRKLGLRNVMHGEN